MKKRIVLDPVDVEQIIFKALKEDASDQDITTNFLIPEDKISEAVIIVKEESVLCGVDIAIKIFQKLDKKVKYRKFYKDSDFVSKATTIISLKGKTRALLAGERTALNCIAYLSGVATNTNRFVKKVKPYNVVILGTRKTTPGLRKFEKYAVRCGGGVNHRINLQEMVLIKDNHRKVYEDFITLPEAIERFKQTHKEPIAVEVDNLIQFKQVLKNPPDIIMLDNMTLSQMRKAVKLRNETGHKKRPLLEATGGVTLRNVRDIAKTGVDRISIGSLTHTHKAIDVSMEIIG